MDDLRIALEERIAIGIRSMHPLGGGCVGEVYRLDTTADWPLVAKVAQGEAATLDREGYMLRLLAERGALPVPKVLYSSAEYLVMEYAAGTSQFDARAEAHAAELLAHCHSLSSDEGFGLEQPTLIGGLHQPNPWTACWVDFFRDHRLRYMAEQAASAGLLPRRVQDRIATLANRLGDFLEEPPAPALLHGDVWTTNVLAADGHITAFLDPAVYYGHPEIELAFITLFDTFGDPFFRRYHELRPIAPGFFETRRGIYNLYPLLVHVRLFGASYLGGITRTLDKLGV